MRVGLFSSREIGVRAAREIATTPGVELTWNHVGKGWWGDTGFTSDDDVFGADPDVVLSVLAYHIFTPEEVARQPIVNFHPAPLPRYRGCHTAAVAINEGAEKFGATMHYIDAGIDTGPIIDLAEFRIDAMETGGSLYWRAQSYVEFLFLKWWPDLSRGYLPPAQIQDEAQARYFPRTVRDEIQRSADVQQDYEWCRRARRALVSPLDCTAR